MGRTLYAKLIGRIAFFTCTNIAHTEFYLQGLLPKILAICTINTSYATLCGGIQGNIPLLTCNFLVNTHLPKGSCILDTRN